MKITQVFNINKFKVSMAILGFIVGSGLTNAAYGVGDDPLLSPEAAAGKHAVFEFDTLNKLKTKAQTLEKIGMRMVDIEIKKDSAGLYTYTGMWQPGSGMYLIERNENWKEFSNRWNQLSQNGYRLLDVERTYFGQNLVYHAVYGQGNDAYVMYANTWSNFEIHWQQMSASGLRLVNVDVTRINGQHHYLGIYRPGNGGYALYSTPDIFEFMTKNDEFLQQGLDLVDVNMMLRSDGAQQWIGVWNAGTGQTRLRFHTSWSSFKTEWVAQADEGYSLLDFDISPTNSK